MSNVYDGHDNDNVEILHDVEDMHLPYYIIFRIVGA